MKLKLWSKKVYRLKGRKNGNWETLEEYDTYMSYRDLSEEIREFIEDGYDYFVFEECNEGYVKCRKKWARKVRGRPKGQDVSMSELVRRLEEYNRLKEQIQKTLGIKELEPQDVIANFIYVRELTKELLKSLGLSESEAEKILKGEKTTSTSDLDKLLDILMKIRQLAPLQAIPPQITPQTIPPLPQTTPQTIQTNPTPQTTPENISTVEELPENIRQKIDSAVEKAMQKVNEALLPPCLKGKCEEKEG